MAEPRRAWTESAEGSDLFSAVGMAELQAVPSGLGRGAGILDALDQPVTALEPHDLANLERLLRRVRVNALLAGAGSRGDVVVEVAVLCARPGPEEGPGRPGPSGWFTSP